MQTKFCFLKITSITKLIFLFCCCAESFSASAKIPSQTLSDSTQQQVEKQNNFLLGINPTQVAMLDVELYARFELYHRHSFFIAAGYDFNAFDLAPGDKIGRPLDPEDQGREVQIEQESDNWERYFWGQGFAFRFGYEVKLEKHVPSGPFLSAEFLLKERNYEHYQFGSGGILHSESADQKIYGLTFRYGYEWIKTKVRIQFTTGIGLRILHSDVTWPTIVNASYNVPAEYFQKDVYLPSLHLGWLIYFQL
jgi:hypothetical protein